MALRTLAMPANTSTSGDTFGDWLISRMDIGSVIMAKEVAQGRVVTVCVDGMIFLRLAAAGDVTCYYTRRVERGDTSMTTNIEVWVRKVSSEPIGQRYKTTEALFICVAVNNQGEPRVLPTE